MYIQRARVLYTTADHTNNPAWTPGRAILRWSLSRPIAEVLSINLIPPKKKKKGKDGI